MLPFVSICTPTFNRRKFIPYLIECVALQTYDKSRIEWIIVDDGSDKVEDLFVNVPCAKYYKYDEQMTLGRKRNVMHEMCSGDIIVYMDDDDYYPEERISHAVKELMNSPHILCAGSSTLHIYFDHINKIFQFGPYKENHATAATFAFKKELLLITKYDDATAVAEEKQFLKNYTIPMIQLDPLKTILVFSHIHNSVDKKLLLDSPSAYIKETSLSPYAFFTKNVPTHLFDFYVKHLNRILMPYDLGKPSLKPILMEQIQELTNQRKKKLAPLQELHDKMMEMRAQYETLIENKEIFIKALIKQNKALKELLKKNY
jgi:glycosyltransferase involved in cell wall biosynthesis